MDNSTFPSALDSTAHSSPRHVDPVLSFIIGLAIILLASVLNAAGLNLTKLDHVRFVLVFI